MFPRVFSPDGDGSDDRVTATYSIDERAQTVTHHRLRSVQPGDTADLVRNFTVEGDKLTLNTVGTNYFVYWERMK